MKTFFAFFTLTLIIIPAYPNTPKASAPINGYNDDCTPEILAKYRDKTKEEYKRLTKKIKDALRNVRKRKNRARAALVASVRPNGGNWQILKRSYTSIGWEHERTGKIRFKSKEYKKEFITQYVTYDNNLTSQLRRIEKDYALGKFKPTLPKNIRVGDFGVLPAKVIVVQSISPGETLLLWPDKTVVWLSGVKNFAPSRKSVRSGAVFFADGLRNYEVRGDYDKTTVHLTAIDIDDLKQHEKQAREALKTAASPEEIAKIKKQAREYGPRSDHDIDISASKKGIKSSGTGFFVSEDGYLLTAAHVVANAKNISISLGQDELPAKLVIKDETNDFAILKVDTKPTAHLTITASSGLNVGDKVFTIGFPNINIQGKEPKYTEGTLSSMSGIQGDPRRFQISVPVQPGNSGGPLVSEDGHAIGIVVSQLNPIAMITKQGTMPQNVNYAVKSSFILPFIENIPSISSHQPNTDQKLTHSDVIKKVKQSLALVIVR